MESIYVEEDNTKYSSDENGVFYNKAQKQLYCYPSAKAGTSYTVPSTVTSISEYAFYEADNLKELHMSEKVTSINSKAFINVSDGFTIYAPGGSKAESAAALCGIDFIRAAYFL